MKSKLRVAIRIILVICVVLLGFALYKGYFLFKERRGESIEKAQKVEALKDDIKSEKDRIKELEKTKKDKDVTDEDYEAIARDEFGLIKKDEIIIKPR